MDIDRLSFPLIANIISMISYEDQMKDPYLWRRANRTNSVTNKAPISMRIEIEGFDRAEFSTGVKATEAEWSQAFQRLQPTKGLSRDQERLIGLTNDRLDKQVKQVWQTYHNMKSQGGNPSPADLREFLRGKPTRAAYSLPDVLEAYYNEQARKDRARNTLHNTRKGIRAVSLYLASIRRPSLSLLEVDRAWCRRLERFYEAMPLSPETIRKYISVVISALDFAVDEGHIKENALTNYKFYTEVVAKDKRCLTSLEVELLETFSWKSKLQLVVDMFLFSCYTGLSYVDYMRFAATPEPFLAIEQGVQGIRMKRQKVIRKNNEFFVPLFAKALTLLYTTYQQQLPQFAPSHLNRQLKKIAQQLGPAHFHLQDLLYKDARSTFAQLMRDQYGLELAAAMAGHTKEIANERYSSMSASRVIEQLTILNAPLVSTSN